MYNPETYWNGVAQKVKSRGNANVIAGDDEPFYRYKRRKFLGLMNSISFTGKRVLEIGCGPGGNLLEIIVQKPGKLVGVDISEEMVKLAKTNTADYPVAILKIDGTNLPFKDTAFDISITATVLQHVTDDEVIKTLVSEACRVSRSDIFIFERIENKTKKSASNTGRTLNQYQQFFEPNGFSMVNVKHINILISHNVCGGIRKIFGSSSHQEGESTSRVSVLFQRMALPITSMLDKLFRGKKDLAMLHFKRTIPV